MTERHRLRERQVWIAVVVALGTSLTWLGFLNVALLASHAGAWPIASILVRTLTRAAFLVLQQSVALVPTLLAAAALVGLLALALRRPPQRARGVRHA